MIDNIGTGLEIVPKSHRRFRTEFENDCLLPEGAKLEGHGSRLGGLDPLERMAEASRRAAEDSGAADAAALLASLDAVATVNMQIEMRVNPGSFCESFPGCQQLRRLRRARMLKHAAAARRWRHERQGAVHQPGADAGAGSRAGAGSVEAVRDEDCEPWRATK